MSCQIVVFLFFWDYFPFCWDCPTQVQVNDQPGQITQPSNSFVGPSLAKLVEHLIIILAAVPKNNYKGHSETMLMINNEESSPAIGGLEARPGAR